MAYVRPNFKSKAELKRALRRSVHVDVYQPGFGCVPENGPVDLEGPQGQPHTWYAEGLMLAGRLTTIK